MLSPGSIVMENTTTSDLNSPIFLMNNNQKDAIQSITLCIGGKDENKALEVSIEVLELRTEFKKARERAGECF